MRTRKPERRTSARFFRQNLKRSVSLIALFFITSFLLFVLYAAVWFAMENDAQMNRQFRMDDALLAREAGYPEDFVDKLVSDGAFVFELDAAGTIVAQQNLPENLNHPYTTADVAGFSRWFLDDHLVYTRVLDTGGILVLGYPKHIGQRYSFATTKNSVLFELFFFPFLLLCNLALFIGLQVRREHAVQKAVGPILDGVGALAGGRQTDLVPAGPLADINAELNQASALLQDKEAARADWISGISHDVRTPLAVISGSAELLMAEQTDPETRKKLVQIQNNAMKIEKLVEALNLNNRLDFARVPAQKRRVVFADLLRDTLAELLSADENPHYPVDITIDPKAEGRPVLMDPDLFSRLLANLLYNARRHNPDGCTTAVALKTEGHALVLTVRDDGSGADPLTLARLNDPQVLDKKGYSPHGMGLLIVRKIVKVHGGRIVFTSDQNGFESKMVFEENDL